MAQAIDALRSRKMGLKTACRLYNVPRTTLQRRCKTDDVREKASEKKLGSKTNVFSPALEDELVGHVKLMESMLFGFTPKRLRQLAYQLAKANGIHDRFNSEKMEAGKDWYLGFMARHKELSLRMPEATSAAHARGFNLISVGKFFDLLEELHTNSLLIAYITAMKPV